MYRYNEHIKNILCENSQNSKFIWLQLYPSLFFFFEASTQGKKIIPRSLNFQKKKKSKPIFAPKLFRSVIANGGK